jgi:hypothetical protein
VGRVPRSGGLRGKRLLLAVHPQTLTRAGAGLLFKGSGFYITDYRSDSYRKAADADSGGGAKKDAPASDAAPAKDAAKSSGSSGSAPSRPE